MEGNWLGTLEVSGIELRVVFKISENAGGGYSATMDSPDQGAKDIPVNKVSIENNQFMLEVNLIEALFEGEIKEESKRIEGVWRQGGVSLPLVLKQTYEVIERIRPQEPKKPFPYDEEEVFYENKKTGIKLAGTMTLPRTKEPVPAVLLITGSGPQDRDETLLGHRPFLVLADDLTRRNMAVLRVDDRGVGGSTGDILSSTNEDFAQDVLSGVEFLKGRKEINPGQIGLIGHSEGGIIAPIVAARSADIAFIVLMAGTGLTGEEIIYLQSELIAKAMGAFDAQIRQNRTLQEKIFAILKSGEDVGAVEKALERLLEEETASVHIAMVSKSQVEAQRGTLLSPWFRSFLTYDPRPALMKVKCPVLAINGEKDLQVPPKENLGAIGEALKAGGNEKVTILELTGLNHLFQTAETGLPIEYGRIEETISPSALEIIGNWILSEGIGLR
jgi:fermentation-respiration switch protein FrsA (DUF1100 family)